MVKRFLFALSFLTVFPFPFVDDREDALGRSAAFFPLVGAVLGGILAAVDHVFGRLFTAAVSSAAVLFVLAFLTAGLHLDGFADTLDGLGAALKYGRERALEVMRDSGTGSFGVTGLVLLILFKYSLLTGLGGHEVRPVMLLLMPAAGRWLLVLVGSSFPYARSTSGLGRGFAGMVGCREVSAATLFIAALIVGTFAATGCAVEVLLAGVSGVLFALLGGLALALFLSRCFGGMTGDTLGAVNEAGELLFLLGAALFLNLESLYFTVFEV